MHADAAAGCDENIAVVEEIIEIGEPVIGSAKDDLEWQPLQVADARAAIDSSKTGHIDQTFDASAPHRRDQHPGRVREQVHRPEQVS